MQLFDPSSITRMFKVMPNGPLRPIFPIDKTGQRRQRVDRVMSIAQCSNIFQIPTNELNQWWWRELMAVDQVDDSLIHFVLSDGTYKPTISIGELNGVIDVLPTDGINRLSLSQMAKQSEIGTVRLKRMWLFYLGWTLQAFYHQKDPDSSKKAS